MTSTQDDATLPIVKTSVPIVSTELNRLSPRAHPPPQQKRAFESILLKLVIKVVSFRPSGAVQRALFIVQLFLFLRRSGSLLSNSRRHVAVRTKCLHNGSANRDEMGSAVSTLERACNAACRPAFTACRSDGRSCRLDAAKLKNRTSIGPIQLSWSKGCQP